MKWTNFWEINQSINQEIKKRENTNTMLRKRGIKLKIKLQLE